MLKVSYVFRAVLKPLEVVNLSSSGSHSVYNHFLK